MSGRRVGILAIALAIALVLAGCTKPPVTTPQGFVFTNVTGVEPGQVGVTSDVVTITGITVPIVATVTAGGELVVGGTPSGNRVTVTNGDRLAVRVDASTDFGGSVTVTVEAGGVRANFTVTTRDAANTPDAFAFDPVIGAEPNTEVTSNPVTITGIETAAAASVSGTGSPLLIVNGDVDNANDLVQVKQGDEVQVVLSSSPDYDTAVTATVVIGGVEAEFVVTTRAAGAVPDAFSFAPVSGAEPNTMITSDGSTITGLETPVTATVAGGGSPVLILNGNLAGVSTTQQVTADDVLAVRLTASSSYSTPVTAVVTIGGVTGEFVVTTRAAVGTPNAFTFDPVTGVERNQVVTSSAVTLSGLETTVTATVTGQGSPVLILNGNIVEAAPSQQVTAGDELQVRLTASDGFDTVHTATVDISGVTAQLVVTTRSAVTTPDSFSFSSVSGVDPNTVVTSASVTIAGIEAPVTASVTGPGSPVLILNGDAAGAAATQSVTAGDELAVRLTASNDYSTPVTAQVSVGGVVGEFTVTTRAANTTPGALSFESVTGAEPGAVITSSTAVVSGLEAPVTATVTGDGSPVLILNGNVAGAAASQQVNAGDELQVRLTASTAFATARTASVDVGGVVATFVVTTRAANTTPGPFSFAAVSGVELDAAVTSSAATVTAVEVPVTATVTGDGSPVLIVNGNVGGAATSQQVSAGDELQVRITSSDSYATPHTATVTINGATAQFMVTTRTADTTPDPFSFDPISGVEPGTAVVSSTVTVGGVEVPVTATVTGGGSPVLILNGDTGTAATSQQVSTGDTLQVRLTSSSGFSTAVTATVSIGGVEGSFTVTTRAAVTVPDPFSFPAVTGAQLSTYVTSAGASLTGLETAATATISGATGSVLIVNGSAVSSPATVQPGDTLQVGITSSGAFATGLTATVDVSGVQALFSVTTRAAVQPAVSLLTTPTAITSATPAESVVLSWTVTGDANTLTLETVPATTQVDVTGLSTTTVAIPGNMPAIQYVLRASDTRHALQGSDATGNIAIPLWVCENPTDVITFADANLLSRFYELPNTPNSGAITCADALAVTEWDTGDWEGSPGNVVSLIGIQHLANLEKFAAHYNQIVDVTPLSGLTNLEWLNLDQNNVSDLAPLAGHQSLRILELWNNGVTDLGPLSGITTLEELYLSENTFGDLSPLAGLTSLKLLFAIGSNISNITPLANLTSLQVLRLNGNNISDASALANLVNLGWLELEYNMLQDPALVPLENFQQLWAVKLEGNYFTDYSPLIDNTAFPAASGVPGLPPYRLQPTTPHISIGYNCLDDDDVPAVVAALQAKDPQLVVSSGLMNSPENCSQVINGGFAIDHFLRQREVLQMYRETDRIR